MNSLVRDAAEHVASDEGRVERMAVLRRMEREYPAVRQMTPREAAAFFDSKGDVAAARVQSAWRGARVRRSIGLFRSTLGEARRAHAAASIQRVERRRRHVRRKHAELRAERDSARAALELELPLIQKRIVDEATQFRLVEAKTPAQFVVEAEHTLADWAELRRRSAIRAAQRQAARADARDIVRSLQAARLVDPDCAHEAIAHLRPLARRGADAPPAPEHARLHVSMTRLAQLDADVAAKAKAASADAVRRTAHADAARARSPRGAVGPVLAELPAPRSATSAGL